MFRPTTQNGCPHLTLQTDETASGTAAIQSEAARALLEGYREAARHSLGYACRAQINIGANVSSKKNVAGRKDTKEDVTDEDPAGIAAGKKRKKPMDAEYVAVEQLAMPSCVTCDACLDRLHVCLTCQQIFCIKDRHLYTHMKENNHIFAMDFEHHNVFCIKCFDYIYDIDFDRILNSEKHRMDSFISRTKDPTIKKPRFTEWSPTPEEVARLKLVSQPMNRCTGLRGLRNLGTTCFMNVVLQTFIHNPLLRAHFMSDRHNKDLCKILATKSVCLACEMDSLFMHFHSGQSAPYGPTSFLFSVWKSNAALAKYAQQDAHEFFMAVLNEVHNSCSGCTDPTASNNNCKCIIHHVFSGVLQSEVTCQRCANITTTFDPIFDLSLNIRNTEKRALKVAISKKKGALAAAATSNIDVDDSSVDKLGDEQCTLIECLERNFAPEKLTAYQCGNPDCGKVEQNSGASSILPSSKENNESLKHVTVKTLPPVLAIQLKRFEHSGQGLKIETFVKVPTELDMTPYTTRSVKIRTKRGKKDLSGRRGPLKGLAPFDPQTDSIPEYRYVLFAVINHQGKLETGHYTAYVKSRNEWFLFDDHNVQLATQKDVLNSKVYMCFYIRENLLISPGAAVEGVELNQYQQQSNGEVTIVSPA